MAAPAGEYSTTTANREEASRAKELALQKLEQKDWAGAKRLLQKAQRLCADLDGVASCIVVAEVHIIADATSRPSPLRELSRDYYAILDVRPDVTKQALIQQYKKRAFQLHPDKNQYPGAEAAFKLLGEAFETLKDDDKRRKYDYQRMQAAAYQSAGRNGHTQVPPPFPRANGGPPFAYGQGFARYPWANFFAGARAPEPMPSYHPTPQRAPNGYHHSNGGASSHVPRDSSGNAFAGYNVKGSSPLPARQQVPARPMNPPMPQPVRAPSTQQQPKAPAPPQTQPTSAQSNQPGRPGAPHPQATSAPGNQPVGPAAAPPQATSAQGNQPGSAPQPFFAQQPRPPVFPSQPIDPNRYISICGSCNQRYTFPISSKDKYVRCQKCHAPFLAKEAPLESPPVQPAPMPPPAANAATGAPRPAAPSTSRVETVEKAWAEAVKLRTDYQKVKKREAKQQRKEEKAAREREIERHIERKEKARKLRAERKTREADERASKQNDDAGSDKPAEPATEAVDAGVLEEGERILLRPGCKPVNIEMNEPSFDGLTDNGKGADLESERLQRKAQPKESEDEPGRKRPATEMGVNGTENGTTEEGRKRRKVCFVELSSEDEMEETEMDPPVSTANGQEAQNAERIAENGSKGVENGEQSGNAKDEESEILPGRRREKHRTLAEILSKEENLAPRSANEPREQPFLFPASGVNVPFAQAKDKGKAVEGADLYSAEKEISHKESNGNGDHLHRQSDGAGPSGGNTLDELPIPDSIFFDFDAARKESDVQAGQFWALYDEVDGMPRFYGRVESVKHNPFSVELTWLEGTDSERESFHNRDNLLWERQISPGVGKFVWGVNQQIEVVNKFAYLQTAINPTSEGAQLFPRCGEIWAMFKLGKLRKEKREKELCYEVVEVVGTGAGYTVTKLVRLPNHSTLFQAVKDPSGKPQRSLVKAMDVHLFSHRVLGKKVPPHMIESNGSKQKVDIWELDPAGLPLS